MALLQQHICCSPPAAGAATRSHHRPVTSRPATLAHGTPQRCRELRTRTRAAVSSQPQQQQAALDELLQLLAPTRRGLDTPAATQAAILAKVAALKSPASVVTSSDDVLSGTWKLLWTTEKETQFIVKNAALFGTQAGGVFQVIDVAGGRLQNVITFPPSGAFIVDSSIAVEGPQRVAFKFTAAKLKTASRDWGVPPFGQGWFDTIFVNERIRIAQDIRGDTLIVERDGPPRIFT